MTASREEKHDLSFNWDFTLYRTYLADARALQVSDPVAALRLCKKAKAEHPDIPEAYLLSGEIEEARKNHKEALAHYSNAVDILPRSVMLRRKRATVLGVVLKENTKMMQDIQIIRHGGVIDQHVRDEYQMKLKRYLRLTSADLQAEKYQKATEEIVSARCALVYGSSKIERYYLENAISLVPRDVHSASTIANRYMTVANVDIFVKGITALSKIITEHHFAEAYAIRGRINITLKKTDLARADIYQFLLRFDRSDDEFLMNEFGKMLFAFYIEDPRYKTNEFTSQALSHFKQRQWAESCVHYALAIYDENSKTKNENKLNKYHFFRYVAATRMYLEKEDLHEAEHALRSAVFYASKTRDHSVLSDICKECHVKGKQEYKKKNTQLAEAYYQLSSIVHDMKLSLSAVEFYADYSQVMSQKGNTKEAAEILKKALKIAPDHERAQNMLFSIMITGAAEYKEHAFEGVDTVFVAPAPTFYCTKNPFPAGYAYSEANQDAMAKKTKLLHKNITAYSKLTESANTVYTEAKPMSAKIFTATMARLDEAAKMMPHFPQAYFFRAMTVAMRSETKSIKAVPLDDINQGIKLAPLDSSYYQMREMVLNKYKRKDDADEDHAMIGLIDKHFKRFSKQYLKRLSDGYFDGKQSVAFDAMVADFRISIFGTFLALHAIANEQLELALMYLTVNLEANPGDFIAWTERAHCYLLYGDVNRAFSDVTKSISMARDAKSLWLRSLIHHQLGNQEQAGNDMVACFLLANEECYSYFDGSKEDVLKILGYDMTHVASSFASEANQLVLTGELIQARIYYSIALWLAEPEERVDYYLEATLIDIVLHDMLSALRGMAHYLELVDQFASFTPANIQEAKHAFSTGCYEGGAEKLESGDHLFAVHAFLAGLLIQPTQKLMAGLAHALHLVHASLIKEDWDKFIFMVPKHSLYNKSMHQFIGAISLLASQNNAPLVSDFLASVQSVFQGEIPSVAQKKNNKKSTLKSGPAFFNVASPKKKKEPSVSRKLLLAHIASTDNESEADTNIEIKSSELKKDAAQHVFRNKKVHEKRKLRRQERVQLRRDKLKSRMPHIQPAEELVVLDALPEAPEVIAPPILPVSQETKADDLDISLFEVEKNLLESFELFNPNLKTYLVGGSIQDRYRDRLLEQKLVNHKRLKLKIGQDPDNDSDLTTEFNEEQLLRVIAPMNPFKPKHAENLYQLILYDKKAGRVKVDIRYNQKLTPLIEDAKKRYIGYFYATAKGKILNPLGEKVLKPLMNNRFYCNYPLETVFMGICKQGSILDKMAPQGMEQDEYMAPLRILLYIYASTKRNLLLEESLIAQIEKDKCLLLRKDITPGMINAKLKKLLLNKRALLNFDKLLKLDIMSVLFPDIIKDMMQDLGWLREEMQATDFIKRPSLHRVYASFLVSAVCERLQISKKEFVDSKPVYFLIRMECEKLIKQSHLFSDLFEAQVNLNAYISPAFSFWMKAHMPQNEMGEEPVASVGITMANKIGATI